jgi:hypothetical protein
LRAFDFPLLFPKRYHKLKRITALCLHPFRGGFTFCIQQFIYRFGLDIQQFEANHAKWPERYFYVWA